MKNLHKCFTVGIALGLALGFAFSLTPPADAARNTGGVYSLPAGNPVVSGTTITSTWANSTLSDLKTEMTNSLSRDGFGAMRAPLKVPDGANSAPSYSFTSDAASGLYLDTAGDVRMAVSSTDLQTWTPTATTVNNAFVAGKGVTVTTTTTNGAGVTATGDGAGKGGVFTGGSTAAVGVLGTGGAGGGTGVQAIGTGTGGFGVVATGGVGTSAINATGGSGTSGGIQATGSGAGTGVMGTGGTSGKGGVFAAGTAATGGTPQTAAELTNGNLALSGANPDSTVSFTDTLTPTNIPKAWGKVFTTGSSSTTATVQAGFNLTSAAVSGTTLTVTIAGDVNSTCSAFITPGLSSDNLHCYADCLGSTVSIQCLAIDGISLPFGYYNFQSSGARNLHVLVFGAQ